MIKTADWVIDLGPEGGHRGGDIIAEGTPEELVTVAASHTGRFLAHVLDPAQDARKTTASKASMISKAERALPPRKSKPPAKTVAKKTTKTAAKTPAKTAGKVSTTTKVRPRKTAA